MYLSTVAYLARLEDLTGSRPVYAMLVDEAGVVPETKLGALLCVNPKRMMFIGDQKQVRCVLLPDWRP